MFFDTDLDDLAVSGVVRYVQGILIPDSSADGGHSVGQDEYPVADLIGQGEEESVPDDVSGQADDGTVEGEGEVTVNLRG